MHIIFDILNERSWDTTGLTSVHYFIYHAYLVFQASSAVFDLAALPGTLIDPVLHCRVVCGWFYSTPGKAPKRESD